MTRIKKRLSLETLRIDPGQKVRFSFGRKRFKGVHGDTVATALYASGVRIFSRSVKFRRPRGLYSLDPISANCMVGINGVPNETAETVLLRPGMKVKPQNVRFSLKRDSRAWLDKLDKLMPAGFVYRRFHKPAFLAPFFLERMRRSAGLDIIGPAFRAKHTIEHRRLFADVCVIGGGPAGMSAALAAADSGCRVILLEARPWLGGHFNAAVWTDDAGIPLWSRIRELEAAVHTHTGIRVCTGTEALGLFPDEDLPAVQRTVMDGKPVHRMMTIRARRFIAATGCTERPLLFENNDLPGVMQADCALRLARIYGIPPGNRAVFCIGHDDAIRAAIDLRDLGVEIQGIADMRGAKAPEVLLAELEIRKIPYWPDRTPLHADGKHHVAGLTLTVSGESKEENIACDLIVASAGLRPDFGILSAAGIALTLDERKGAWLPKTLPDGIFCAGSLSGFGNPQAVELSGRLAGLRAAAGCGKRLNPDDRAITALENELAGFPEITFNTRVPMPVSGRKVFVCLDSDTTLEHLRQSCDLGFLHPELVKRFTGAGTGPGQGGIPGDLVPMAMAAHPGRAPGDFRPTRQRPPARPALLGDLAGPRPFGDGLSPLHDTLRSAGAVFVRRSGWRQAARFLPETAMEVRNVRRRIGIMDDSCRGKFRIFGPGALDALQRVYINDLSRLGVGEAALSAMCDPLGGVADLGWVTRQGPADYLILTRPERAAGTEAWFRRYADPADGRPYFIADLTHQFALVRVAGPEARYLLQPLTPSNISAQALPVGGFRKLAMKETLPCHAVRSDDLGELTFDLLVPASLAHALWTLLMETGRDLGVKPFGVRAQTVLHLEAGNPDLLRETDIRTSLADLGLGHLRSGEKANTPGADALSRRPTGLVRVGFTLPGDTEPPVDGALILDERVRGHVCLARKSPTLNAVIGTALVNPDLSTPGAKLPIRQADGATFEAEVTALPFYKGDAR